MSLKAAPVVIHINKSSLVKFQDSAKLRAMITWVARLSQSSLQVFCYPLITKILPIEAVASIATITGLQGAFAAAELGSSNALQVLAYERTPGRADSGIVAFGAALSLVCAGMLILPAAFVASISVNDASRIFIFIASIVLCVQPLAAISYRMRVLRGESYKVNIGIAGSVLLSMMAIYFMTTHGIKHASVYIFLLCAPVICVQVVSALLLAGEANWREFACHFSALRRKIVPFFGVFVGVFALGRSEFLLLPLAASGSDLVGYRFISSIFFVLFMFFGALLAEQMPTLSRAYSLEGGVDEIVLKKMALLVLGALAFVALGAVAFSLFQTKIINILLSGRCSPKSGIWVLGYSLYIGSKILGDTASAVLLTHGEERFLSKLLLLILVPGLIVQYLGALHGETALIFSLFISVLLLQVLPCVSRLGTMRRRRASVAS